MAIRFQKTRIGLGLCAAMLTTQAMAFDPTSPFGVTAFVPGPVRWQAMQDAMIVWNRCAFEWMTIETSQNNFNWAQTDQMVAEANARGLKIYAGLSYSPPWATSDGNFRRPAANPADWADFCTQVVNRYKASVQHWELWNEPNLTQFFIGTRQQYIDQVLKVGADAIHAADPSAKVVGPEISTCTASGCAPTTWMTDVLNQAGNKIDIISHHQYDGNNTVSGRLTAIDNMRNTVVNLGHGHKDLWISESGFRSDGGSNTLTTQANNLVGMLKGMETRPWFKKFFWYQIWEGDPGEKWGLLFMNETKKPSWFAYRDYVFASAWGPQTPFAGAIPVPGTIQAENFDNGGQGVGYKDLTGGNSGGAYRSTDVDIEGTSDAGGGYNVGWIDTGEFLKYTINVTTPGTYTVSLRVASAGAGGSYHLELQGINVSGTKTFPGTGGWQTWTTVTVPNISFTSGQKVLKVVVDGGGWNLNWVQVGSGGTSQVTIDMGDPDINNGLTHIVCCDGITVPWPAGGRMARANNTEPDHYFYFNISDSFAFQGNKPNLTFIIDYWDHDTGNFSLQYDASSTPYKVGPSINFTNTHTWKTVTWAVNDAYAGNRQNGGSDFRLAYFNGLDFYLDIVRVTNP